MRKYILRLLVIILISIPLIILGIKANAQTVTEFVNNNKNNGLDSEIIEQLSDSGIGDLSFESLSNLSFTKIINVIISSIVSTIKNPILLLPALLSSVLLLNVFDITCFNYIKPHSFTSSLFKTAVFGALTLGITLKGMYKSITALKICNNFSLAIIPIFITLLSLYYKPGSSAAFQTTMIVFCNTFSSVITYVIVPSVYMICALSVGVGITDSPLLKRMHSFLTVVLKYGISIFMAVFSTVLSAKMNIASSIDSVSGQLLKSAVSSTVPVIGSYIADSLSSMKGIFSVLKSGVGIYAVLAMILIILPSFIEMLLLSLIFKTTDSINSKPSFLSYMSKGIGILTLSQICSIIMYIFSFYIVLGGI